MYTEMNVFELKRAWVLMGKMEGEELSRVGVVLIGIRLMQVSKELVWIQEGEIVSELSRVVKRMSEAEVLVLRRVHESPEEIFAGNRTGYELEVRDELVRLGLLARIVVKGRTDTLACTPTGAFLIESLIPNGESNGQADL